MFNKLYDKTINFIKEKYIYICFYFVLTATMLYPLPYYIYNGGGTIAVDNRIEIKDSYKNKGSFNLCYVSELKATLPTFILAKILPSWDLISTKDIVLNETESSEDVFLRDRIFLNDANMNAIKVAYQKANKHFEIVNTKNYIIYLTPQAKTNLKIGDDIKKINNEVINNLDEIKNIVLTKEVGDKLYFTVIRNNKEINCYAEVYEINNEKQIGLAIQSNYDYETNPKITLNFKPNEAGPSGGLLLTLSIYNHLTETDITNGKKIAGTGTIDESGNVGEIGGVKYKLSGAVQNKADIFIVPNGDNYKEAIKLKEKHNYNIKIIGVSTFDEALEKLKK